ncbi:VOC family protein [Aspergillus lucknowensis]|uniref:VOC domain-containing protein n=1 Tax=Aspergillus lucknowensis TaxID=176173 RepID=A0ABR4M4F4_9EURO
MRLANFLVGLSMGIQWASACDPTTNSSTPGLDDLFHIGNDGPAPPETLGYFINHVGLLTTNLAALKHFYVDILGLRQIFDVTLTPEFTITYLGYAQGGRNGTGFQTGEELNREKNNLAGLLEIVQFNASDDNLLSSTKRTNTFGHIGLIVPDIVKAQEYLESKGVQILKRYGEPIKTFTGPVNNAFGIGEYAGAHIAAKKRLMEAQGLIGLPLLVMVADPDGNLVEIQQQEQPTGVL